MHEILVFIIQMLVIFFFLKGFITAFNDEKKHINVIDYVCMNDIWDRTEGGQATIQQPKKKKPKKKTVAAPQAKSKADLEKDLLMKDCEQALKKLGCNKQHTKYVINDIFSKHAIKDVSQFIKLAFGRN